MAPRSDVAHLPHVRYAALSGYLEVALELGIDPARLAHTEGIDLSGAHSQDTWIPAVKVARLLEASARESGHDDFGLLLSQRRRFSNLGPLSMVLREERDVRSALELMIRYQHTYNEALHLDVAEQDGLARVGFWFEFGSGKQAAPQSSELVLAVICELLRNFLGATWQPVAVSLPRAAPDDPSLYERVLGTNISYGQPQGAVAIYSADLDREFQGFDQTARDYAFAVLPELEQGRPSSTAMRARAHIDTLLPIGGCSVDQVARLLGLNRRTLHRHLKSEETTFSELVDQARVSLVERSLLSGRHSLTEISQHLGFAAPSGLSRWFQSRYQQTPTAWLAAQRTRSGR